MPSSREPEPKVTVVIPNWNGMKWLDGCLKALDRQDTSAFVTLVVDNGSTDGSVAFIKKNYPHIEVVSLRNNTGFANAANVGIEKSATPYVALLNTDTQVYPNWLSGLLEKIEKSPPDVGAINPQMLRMDDRERLDDAGDELSWYGAATKRGHNQPARWYDKEEEVFSTCAGASLYRQEFLLKIGGFDKAFFSYLEDVDLGLRGRLLGYRYLYLPAAKVLHKGQGSGIQHGRLVELTTRNRLLLFTKNVPASLLLRHAAKLFYGQVYFLVAYARPVSSLKGFFSFIAWLPVAMKERKRILKDTIIDPAELDALLGGDPPNPTLSTIVKGRLSRLMGKRKSAPSSR